MGEGTTARAGTRARLGPFRALLLLLLPLAAARSAPLAGLSAADTVESIESRYVHDAPARVAALHAAPHGPPSRRAPFVFFHLRKSAGSMVRRYLHREAHKRQLRTFIPCHGVPCQTYRLGPTRPRPVPAIIGGHFYYAGVQQALRWAANGPRPLLDATAESNFSCFTVLRAPVSRVESCWNFRLEKHGAAKPFAMLTAAEVAQYLPSAMDSYGSGCNNEALRIFAGARMAAEAGGAGRKGRARHGVARSSAGLRMLRTALYPHTHTLPPPNWSFSDMGEAELQINTATAASPGAPFMLQSALRNMRQCVVGVLERCEDTADVMRAAFPWLPRLPCDTRANVYGAKMERGGSNRTLDAGVEREVRMQNRLEESAYRFANAMLDAHLTLVRSMATKKRHPLRYAAEHS